DPGGCTHLATAPGPELNCDGELAPDQSDRVPVHLRRRAAGPRAPSRVARASSKRRVQRRREARDGARRDDGRAGPGASRRLGQKLLRRAERGGDAARSADRRARPRARPLRPRDEGGARLAARSRRPRDRSDVVPRGARRRAHGAAGGRRSPPRQHSSAGAEERKSALASGAGASDHDGPRQDALAHVRAGRRHRLHAFAGRAGSLAHGSFRELRPVRAGERNRRLQPAAFGAVGLGRDFPDPGDVLALSRIHSDLPRAAQRGDREPRPLNPPELLHSGTHAVTVISTSRSGELSVTSTVVRAGLFAGKYLPYSSLYSARSSRLVRYAVTVSTLSSDVPAAAR